MLRLYSVSGFPLDEDTDLRRATAHQNESPPYVVVQVVEDDSGVLEVVMAAAEVETVAHQLVAGIGR